MLSVIVPTRNRAWLVKETLPTLAQQQHDAPYEVIVVDNGSTDETARVVDEAAARWPHVRRLWWEPPGAAGARHGGALAATGSIVFFMDDDMYAEPDVLARHARIHAEVPRACVLGNVVSVRTRHPFERMMAYVYDGPRSTLAGRTPTFEDVWPGHLSMPKDVYLEIGGFNPRFAAFGSYAGGEGIDFGLRVIQSGIPVLFAKEALTRHRFTARFGDALRRAYVNGKAFGILMNEQPLTIGGVAAASSPWRARLAELACRAVAAVLEPVSHGEGDPSRVLARVYSVGLSQATGRGVREGLQRTREDQG
jgi:glycosyltransferase involved in cell wall biosynthesis